MSGFEMLDVERTRQVNVGGVKAAIEVNVTFGGQRIDGVDEDHPLYPIDRHVDEYSRTKAIAETMVLKANGRKFVGELNQDYGAIPRRAQLRKNGTLRTVSIRTNGIYGEGEERHFARMIAAIKVNALVFRYGYPNNLVDWTHVDNVALSHMLAAVKLVREATGEDSTGIVSAGQPYFVSDNDPVNNFDVFQKTIMPLYNMHGPYFNIPLAVMYRIAHVLELSYKLISPFVSYYPPILLLTRSEVLKSGQHHWFRIDKIRRELGYESVTGTLEGFQAIVKYLEVADRRDVRRDVFERYPKLMRRLDGTEHVEQTQKATKFPDDTVSVPEKSSEEAATAPDGQLVATPTDNDIGLEGQQLGFSPPLQAKMVQALLSESLEVSLASPLPFTSPVMDSVATVQWKCPACQSDHEGIPKKSQCWCGGFPTVDEALPGTQPYLRKSGLQRFQIAFLTGVLAQTGSTINPQLRSDLLPHSCGAVCGKPLQRVKRNLSHPDDEDFNDGDRRSSLRRHRSWVPVDLVGDETPALDAEVVWDPDEFEEHGCERVCGKILKCGKHQCKLMAASKFEVNCQCGRLKEMRQCLWSASDPSLPDIHLKCDALCDTLTKFGRYSGVTGSDQSMPLFSDEVLSHAKVYPEFVSRVDAALTDFVNDQSRSIHYFPPTGEHHRRFLHEYSSQHWGLQTESMDEGKNRSVAVMKKLSRARADDKHRAPGMTVSEYLQLIKLQSVRRKSMSNVGRTSAVQTPRGYASTVPRPPARVSVPAGSRPSSRASSTSSLIIDEDEIDGESEYDENDSDELKSPTTTIALNDEGGKGEWRYSDYDRKRSVSMIVVKTKMSLADDAKPTQTAPKPRMSFRDVTESSFQVQSPSTTEIPGEWTDAVNHRRRKSVGHRVEFAVDKPTEWDSKYSKSVDPPASFLSRPSGPGTETAAMPSFRAEPDSDGFVDALYNSRQQRKRATSFSSSNMGSGMRGRSRASSIASRLTGGSPAEGLAGSTGNIFAILEGLDA
ncbi:hypothetical protein HDU93_005561 [Gonapodya sp. JEL0774]|nr:hypothetical protein HDU93_005561 [Gonapodya sp. JEL0774]